MYQMYQMYQNAQMGCALSLDEYIRKRKMEDQFSLLNHRKSEVEISQEALDMDLDDYIRDARVEKPPEPAKSSRGASKFDRKSIRGEDSSDDEEDSVITVKKEILDDDVDMNGKFKTLETIEENGEDGLDGLLNFTTVEWKKGLQIPSQQWRIQSENIDKPKSDKHAVFSPLNARERFRGVRKGNVHKNRSRTSSFSSCRSDITIGSFVEKGKFTYKFGDRNRDGQSEGIIGIERAKRFGSPESHVVNVASTAAPPIAAPININMNWDGFFTGFNQVIEKTQKLVQPEPATESASSQLASATERLLSLLQNQRDLTRTQKLQKDLTQIQGRAFVACAGRGRQNIMPPSASSVFNFENPPQSSSMPMNIHYP